MTPHQLVGLAVRLFAIWVIFLALQMVGLGRSMNSQTGLQPTDVFYISAAAMFVVAILLWSFPLSVANKLIPHAKCEHILRIPATEATAVACIILGLWLFVVRVLPSFAYDVSLVVAMIVNHQALSVSDEFTIVKLGTVAIEFFVCLFLCFKAHTISRFFSIGRNSMEKK